MAASHFSVHSATSIADISGCLPAAAIIKYILYSTQSGWEYPVFWAETVGVEQEKEHKKVEKDFFKQKKFINHQNF